jgi:hypothetical protein
MNRNVNRQGIELDAEIPRTSKQRRISLWFFMVLGVLGSMGLLRSGCRPWRMAERIGSNAAEFSLVAAVSRARKPWETTERRKKVRKTRNKNHRRKKEKKNLRNCQVIFATFLLIHREIRRNELVEA